MSGPVPRWLRETFGWLAAVLWPAAFLFLLLPVREHCPAPVAAALSHACDADSRLAWGIASSMLAVLMSFAYVVALLRRDDT